jgi:hypothetical protein
MHLENNHCISNGYFDRKYCDEIISQAETSKLHMAKVQDGLNINRKSKITWLTNDKLNKNINEIILDHNKKAKWNFVLNEFGVVILCIYLHIKLWDNPSNLFQISGVLFIKERLLQPLFN